MANAASAPLAQGKEEFTITRTLDAPRELVWKAFTNAEMLAKWWGPKGCDVSVKKLEFKPEGIFHYLLTWQQTGDMWGRFIYKKIEAPGLLEYVSSFSDAQGGITRAPFFDGIWPDEVYNIVTFTESGGKTTVALRAIPLHAREDERQSFLNNHGSMTMGFSGTFEQLAAYLASIK